MKDIKQLIAEAEESFKVKNASDPTKPLDNFVTGYMLGYAARGRDNRDVEKQTKFDGGAYSEGTRAHLAPTNPPQLVPDGPEERQGDQPYYPGEAE